MQPKFGNLNIPNLEHALLDSFIVPGFLQTSLGIDSSALFADLQDTAPWTDPSDPDFKYRGNELARRKAFLVTSTDPVPKTDEEPSVMPKYSYPGWQNASMRSYRDMRTVPSLHKVVERIKQELLYNDRPVNINHAILTCYRGADDNIGYHSDKMRDIQRDTPIVSLSLGEEREFHIGRLDPKKNQDTITTHRFVLRPGDLFILGPMTNAAYRHSIVPVHQESLIQRDPSVEVGPRISIVLRDIRSMITREEARKRAARTEKNRRGQIRKTAGKVKAATKARRTSQKK